MPDQVHRSWLDSMADQPERSRRILAWAEATDGFVVAGPATLSVQTADDEWHRYGWHTLEKGSWNAETRKLSWSRYADLDGPGTRHDAVTLSAPGRLPELFRERMAASVVVERLLTVSGDRGVILHGRRDLGPTHPEIVWHASLTRGLSWRTPGLREVADEALADLRREYDPGAAELPRLDSNQQPAG